MPLQKTRVTVQPNGVDQRTEKSQLATGKMTALVNVHQPKPGLYAKRNGYASLGLGSSDGTIANGRGLASDGNTLLLRTKDGLYTYSAGEAAPWVRKMAARTVSVKPPAEVMPYGYKPSMVVSADGKFKYYFSADIGQNSAAQATELNVGNGGVLYNRATYWYFRIVDAVTGAEITATTKISAAVGWQARAVVTTGFVWLFIGAESAGGRYIYVAKFDTTAAPDSLPTVSTYYDTGVAGGRAIHGWDARQDPTGNVVVVIAGTNIAKSGGGTADAVVSFLDPATSLPKASPGSVGVALGALSAQACVAWLEDEDDPTPAAYYLAIMGGGLTKPKAYKIHLTALTLTSGVVLAGFVANAAVWNYSLIAGYHQNGTDYYVTLDSSPGSGPSTDTLALYKHTSAGAAVGAGLVYGDLDRTLVSRVFRLTGGTDWYAIAMHDDNLVHAQASYYLIQVADGKILGRTLYGAGGDAGQRASYVVGVDNYGWIDNVFVDTTTVTLAVNVWQGQQYVTKEIVFIIDDSGTGSWGRLGPLIAAAQGQEIAIPNAWPLHLAGGIVAEYVPAYPDTAPMVSQYLAPPGAGLPTGVYLTAYLWSLTDGYGNVHRSAPSPAASVTIKITPDVDAMVFVAAPAVLTGFATITVVAATTANLAVTAAGTGVGKTLTANANGAITIDGTLLALNDLLLVKDQLVTTDNGIYKVTVVGDAGNPFKLTRAVNYDQAAEVLTTVAIPVTTGTVNAATTWVVLSVGVIQWQVTHLHQTNSRADDWQIELYASLANGTAPFLQYAIPNDPGSSAATTFQAFIRAIDTHEALYTYAGGELPNSSPPPFGCAGAWRNRLFLADTDTAGDVWVSKEKQPGIGYSFAVDLTFNISDGTPRIRAMGAVDFNYFALFKEDGIWVISGPGPDSAQAAGMYEPVRVPGNIGCTNPSSVISTPSGLLFQASENSSFGDGGIYLLTRDLQVMYLGRGVENYRGQAVAAATMVPEVGQARVLLRTG